MKSLYSTLLLFAFLITNKNYSQSSTLDKVVSFDFKNIRAIEENGIVKGYFFFFKIDKVDRDDNKYGLYVYDNNFNQTHYKELIKSKKTKLIDSKFNGTTFCFQFYDEAKRKYEYNIYDTELNEKGLFTFTISKDLAEAIESAATLGYTNYSQTHTLVPLPNSGYAIYGNNLSTKAFELIAFNNTGVKIWEFDAKKISSKPNVYGNYIKNIDDNMVFEISKVTVRGLRKPAEVDQNVFLINFKDGSIKLQTKLNNKDRQLYINDFVSNENGYTLFAEITTTSSPFPGTYICNLSKTGGLIDDVALNLNESIPNFIKDKDQSDLLKNKSCLIHEVIPIKDKIYVIGEFYDKKHLYDGVVFVIQNNSVSNVFIYKKKKAKIESVFFNTSLNSQAAVGMMLKTLLADKQDYCYTSLNSTKVGFTTVFCNYEKENKDSDYIIGTINLSKDNTLSSDEVKMISKPDAFKVLPAKPGYVAIFEYFEKEKRIAMKFEKLNL